MSEIDAECMRRFPEMVDHFSRESLDKASAIGSYIFFEDYFNAFVVYHGKDAIIFKGLGRLLKAWPRVKM